MALNSAMGMPSQHQLLTLFVKNACSNIDPGAVTGSNRSPASKTHTSTGK
jgi:hypothetical protein